MAFLKFPKLLKDFSGTAIFTFLNTLLSSIAIDFPMKLDLYLKDAELLLETLSGFPAFVTGDSSLLNCHKLPVVSALPPVAVISPVTRIYASE